jgi:hypothetical protein
LMRAPDWKKRCTRAQRTEQLVLTGLLGGAQVASRNTKNHGPILDRQIPLAAASGRERGADARDAPTTQVARPPGATLSGKFRWHYKSIPTTCKRLLRLAVSGPITEANYDCPLSCVGSRMNAIECYMLGTMLQQDTFCLLGSLHDFLRLAALPVCHPT